MRLRPDQLAAHLRKTLATLYLVYGEETLVAQEAADLIRAAARQQGCGEREILTVGAGFDWHTLRQLAAREDWQVVDVVIDDGDTGSNLAGALAGVCLLTGLDETGRLIGLAVVILLTVYGEFRSISKTIERIPPLRFVDSLGRVK